MDQHVGCVQSDSLLVYFVLGKLNQVLGDQWYWQKSGPERARDSLDMSQLTDDVIDEGMFTAHDKHGVDGDDSANKRQMVTAVPYSVNKKVGFQNELVQNGVNTNNANNGQADFVLEEREIRPQNSVALEY